MKTKIKTVIAKTVAVITLTVIFLTVPLRVKSQVSGTCFPNDLPSERLLVSRPDINFPGISTQERNTLQGNSDGWLDTPYGNAENALKVPVGEMPAIPLLLLIMGYGVMTRKRI